MRDIKEEVKEYLENNYTETSIEELVDNEIVDGCWADDGWEDDYESEYDWYVEFGKGEAEDVIRGNLETELCAHFSITTEKYEEEAEEPLYRTIADVFTKLDT
jgi:hypothetical protein